MRTLLYTTLRSTAAFANLIGGPTLANVRLYEASAIGVGTIPAKPKRPYATIIEMPTGAFPEVRGTLPSAASHVFQITAYCDRGSYLPIDNILNAARNTIGGLVLQVSTTGARCVDAQWLGHSQDLSDPDEDINLRFATVRLVSNQ